MLVNSSFGTRTDSYSGDWGTLTVQLYLTRLDNVTRRPHFFEGEDDWELVTRITNFNYTGLADGKLNIRVGHFEIPYGLEGTINTNGTLRQLLTGPNLGVKADWGAGINGTLPKNGVIPSFKYDLTASRGTGNEWSSRGDPYVIAGRIGTPDDQESFHGSPGAGVSVFYGDVAGRAGTTNRLRVGLDGTVFLGPFTMLGEVSGGRDEGNEVVNGLLEVNCVSAMEAVTFYTQLRSRNINRPAGWTDAWASAFGIRYTPDNNLALSAQYLQDWTTFSPGPAREGLLAMQIRYRF